ncbi:MAG: PIN domain-containing protein [Candidatus Aminicenantes bacterium]|nr:PIN domain-containing protein [Candidatus Aminicenantes bacterium]
MKYTADTSFIIGLFVDEPRTSVAKELFGRLKAKKEKLFIPAQTIVEVIYVLEKFYKLERQKVAEYVFSILGTSIFIVEKYRMFYKVIEVYKENPSINLGDIIIAEESKEKGISTILTFDSHFEKLGLKIFPELKQQPR